MRVPAFIAVTISALILAAPTVSQSQSDDLFSFIPAGGRTLLSGMVEHGVSEDFKKEIASEKKTSAEWLSLLDTAGTGADELDEYQRQTLADYLGHNAPLGDLPADPNQLPMDGRDMALRYCQSCHIITVVVTQDRAKEAWLGTLGKPSHVEIKLTAEQRDALADYLVVNAGIPIENVPPALRAGGASY